MSRTLPSSATRLNTVMLAVVAVVLIMIVALSYWEWSQYRRGRAEYLNSQEIQQSSNNLLLDLVDAETGQRGFLLTGQERYLEPYNRAIREIPADLANLKKLLGSRQGGRRAGQRLNGLVGQKIDDMRVTINLRKARASESAINVVLSGQGKQSMDEIRALLSEIQNEEYSVLADAQSEAANAAERAFLVTAVGSLILLFLSMTGALKINTAIRSREDALSAAQNARDSLKTTLASIGDAVVATDLKGYIVFANKVAQSLLQTPEADLVGRRLDDVFHIVDEFTRAKVESPVTKVLREGAVAGLANHAVLIGRDGRETPIDDSGAPIRGESATVRGTVLVFRDVTDRRRAERNAGYLQAIVESADYAIIGKSLEGKIESWNAGAERLYGYRAEEMVGHSMSELIPADRLHEESNILEQIRSGAVVHLETCRSRKDGSLVDVSQTISPIRDKEGQIIGVSHLARDITEEKRNAERMRQTQKLESLGVLAGGIAHDFNNLLAGILGNASLALEELDPGSPGRRSIEGVIAASERAAELTRQMLAYSGRGAFVLERMDLSNRIRQMAPLIQAAIPRTAALRFDLAEGLPAIEADPAQIQQLVMNIVINGAEAIPQGRPGTVTITTRLQQVDSDFLRTQAGYADLKPGWHILLEVRDTGSGMDEATKGRIFEPFFTTKFAGRGLGLAAVLGIVRGHRGSIQVSSRLGDGTVFRVLLPATEAAAEPDSPRPGEIGGLHGEGLVLIIDDEESVRRMAKSALERYGYNVLLAEDGEHGLKIFRREAGRIQCVVLDLTMPVMSGEETLARMRALGADIPVILSSGYNEVDAVSRFEGKGLAGFLQKPYKATALVQKVRDALKAARAQTKPKIA
jgi:PAS domain S-box-containing protein